MDSIPAGKALCIIREEKPLSAFEFGSHLLKLFYRDGISPIDLDGIAQLASSFNSPIEEFKKKMLDPKYDEKIQDEYNMVANIGIRGFAIFKGFDEKEMKLMENFMDRILENIVSGQLE